MKQLAALIIILGVLAAVCNWAAASENGHEQTVIILVDSARDKLALPSVFNFEEFKRRFDKHYENELEETLRESLFSARLVRAFTSAINYKNSDSRSYLSLNDRSDWTNEEILSSPGQANKSSVDNLLLGLPNDNEDDAWSDVGLDRDDDGHINNGVILTLTEAKTAARPVVLLSRKKRGLGDQELQAKAIGGQTAKRENSVHKSSFTSLLLKVPKNKKDFVRKDLRRTDCLSSVRDQGRGCNISYNFAILAAYEYKYCRMKREKVEFSAQFAVDCGHLSGLNGCEEGDIARLIRFIDTYGLETRQEYSYYGRQLSCPYEANTPVIDMGRFKTETNFKRISIDEFDKYLAKLEPIVVKLKAPDNFGDYEGGVDSLSSCDESNGFVTMLLVGSGREDGLDYWLFRNSHSTSWGAEGHYKLDQRARRCIADKGGLLIRPLAFRRNLWRRLISDNSRPGGGPSVVIAS